MDCRKADQTPHGLRCLSLSACQGRTGTQRHKNARPGYLCRPSRPGPRSSAAAGLFCPLSVVLAMPAGLPVLTRARSGARPAPLTLSPSWFAGTLAGAVDLEQHDNCSDQLPRRVRRHGAAGDRRSRVPDRCIHGVAGGWGGCPPTAANMAATAAARSGGQASRAPAAIHRGRGLRPGRGPLGVQATWLVDLTSSPVAKGKRS
jgi:hypothetical protein